MDLQIALLLADIINMISFSSLTLSLTTFYTGLAGLAALALVADIVIRSHKKH